MVGDQPEVTTVATPGEMEDVMGWDSQLIEQLILVYKHVRHKNRGEMTSVNKNQQQVKSPEGAIGVVRNRETRMSPRVREPVTSKEP